MRQAETRRRMAAVVRAWHQSTDTQAAFAARHGISRHKLIYWLRRSPPPEAGRQAVTFAPVRIVGGPADEAAAIDIVLAGGERVVVRPGTSPALLQVVLATLRSAC